MRVKGNRYYGYAYITDSATGKLRQIEFSLDAYKGEKRKAIINLGKCLEQMGRGDLPNTRNLKFQQVAERWKKNPVCPRGLNRGSHDNLLILNETLTPHYGNLRIREITQDTVKTYLALMESDKRPPTKNKRSKQKLSGKKKSTLQKELRVLKWVMQSVQKTWENPFWEFKNLEKEKLDAPGFDQVVLMIDQLPGLSKNFGKEYQDIAWVMALTGLDVSDVLKLSRTSFKDGLIIGRRGKTGQLFKIGDPETLKPIFQKRKTIDLSPDVPIFKVKSSGSVSKAIGRAFKDIGLKQFHAKSLRDFHASTLDDAGFSEPFIQNVLGHAPGSRQTRKYIIASKNKLKEAAGVFDSLHVLKKEGNRK